MTVARPIHAIAVLGAGTEAFRPPAILRQMVSEGKLGKKCGEGFYKWNEQEPGQKAYTS